MQRRSANVSWLYASERCWSLEVAAEDEDEDEAEGEPSGGVERANCYF